MHLYVGRAGPWQPPSYCQIEWSTTCNKPCPRLYSLQVKAEPKDVKAATVQKIFHAVRDFLAYVPADLHSMSEEDVHRDAEYRFNVLLASFADEPEAMDYFKSQWGGKIGERRFNCSCHALEFLLVNLT
jgi:hypothetical protein